MFVGGEIFKEHCTRNLVASPAVKFFKIRQQWWLAKLAEWTMVLTHTVVKPEPEWPTYKLNFVLQNQKKNFK